MMLAEQPLVDVPLNIVGSNTYGRYPKISGEQTFNMIISDGVLVPMPGYLRSLNVKQGGQTGRKIYSSTNINIMIQVIDDTVYRISGPENFLNAAPIFTLNSTSGDVFVAENNAKQIAVCDQSDLWIYNWKTGLVNKAPLPINTETGLEITPGYVSFHNGYLIVPDITSYFWYLSQINDGLSWNWNSGSPVAGALQTKGDTARAVLPVPGIGSLLLVFGRYVTEFWNANSGQLFPYTKNTSINCDYGCASVNTIASLDNMVVWLGINESSGASIMWTEGGKANRLTTDGIDFQLGRIVNPSASTAFLYRQNGHTFYQITFTDPADNVTILYDFTTQKFFTPTDENMNFHIAANLAFFNNTYYFASITDGYLYELSSDLTTYNYTEPSILPVNPNVSQDKTIPRVRVCRTIREGDGSRFEAVNLSFVMEQGQDEFYKNQNARIFSSPDGIVVTDEAAEGYIGTFISSESPINLYVPAVDLSVSRDGAEVFGNFIKQDLNPLADRANKMVFYRLGAANEFTVQLRFWSKARVVVFDGNVKLRRSATR